MKKKLLTVALLVVAISCLLALGVCAEEMNPDYNEQYVKAMTQGMTTVELADGTSVDLYDAQGYTLCYYWSDLTANKTLKSVRTKDLTFNFNGTKLYSVYYDGEELCGTATKGRVVVLNLRGVKNSSGAEITNFNGDNMFKETSSLQHIFMPDSIVSLTGYAFGARSAGMNQLRGCYFSENSQLNSIPSNAFMNADQLRGFYIPKGVTTVGYNGFQGCHNAFFVNDPYDFLTKPGIYYFPENLYKAEGEAFDSFKYNMNRVLVFSADNMEITNGFAFESVSCGNGQKPIIVFTGTVNKVEIVWWTLEAVYFTNPSVTFENVKCTLANPWSYSTSAPQSVHFCATGEAYKFADPADKNATLICTPVKLEGEYTHLAERAEQVNATCTQDAGLVTFCFCGHNMGGNLIEGSALGHEFNVANGATDLGIAYANGFFKAGTHCFDCARCDEIQTNDLKPIFYWVGFSAKTFGEYGFGQQYIINVDEMAAYKAYLQTQGKTFSYGVVAAGASSQGNPLSVVNGAVAAKAGAEFITFDNVSYDAFFMNITGMTENDLNAALVCCAYVQLGDEVVYLDNNETVSSVTLRSYNDIDAIVNPKEEL